MAFAVRCQLGITDFKVSERWLDKFNKRQGIHFKKICGEGTAVRKQKECRVLQEELIFIDMIEFKRW